MPAPRQLDPKNWSKGSIAWALCAFETPFNITPVLEIQANYAGSSGRPNLTEVLTLEVQRSGKYGLAANHHDDSLVALSCFAEAAPAYLDLAGAQEGATLCGILCTIPHPQCLLWGGTNQVVGLIDHRIQGPYASCQPLSPGNRTIGLQKYLSPYIS